MEAAVGGEGLGVATAFGEDDFEERGFAYVRFADHPACAAPVPDLFFYGLGPPSSLCADASDVTEADVLAFAAEGVAEELADVGKEGVYLLFLWCEKVCSGDDEEYFRDSTTAVGSVL